MVSSSPGAIPSATTRPRVARLSHRSMATIRRATGVKKGASLTARQNFLQITIKSVSNRTAPRRHQGGTQRR
ncbi:hypothetical protein GCM10010168_93490 [Actinoplanes ianthinogenes]|uniref:Uncharacterized protein n=1 Tax=Actinoplanes ianthinogenes TaxID=122358 RepID=A0ABM7LKL8_9ACTN|nr:hypothetical protein Aiant_04350 [Actinoplanes ianthinogenes]GGR59987.1 hypothetical protein GCM10010168_93490 [Actinoplanes ianthinogenes]